MHHLLALQKDHWRRLSWCVRQPCYPQEGPQRHSGCGGDKSMPHIPPRQCGASGNAGSLDRQPPTALAEPVAMVGAGGRRGALVTAEGRNHLAECQRLPAAAAAAAEVRAASSSCCGQDQGREGLGKHLWSVSRRLLSLPSCVKGRLEVTKPS